MIRDKIGERSDRCRLVKGGRTFIKGKPCLSKAINLFEEVTMRADRGEATNIICLDTKMAFDTGTLKTSYKVTKHLMIK